MLVLGKCEAWTAVMRAHFGHAEQRWTLLLIEWTRKEGIFSDGPLSVYLVGDQEQLNNRVHVVLCVWDTWFMCNQIKCYNLPGVSWWQPVGGAIVSVYLELLSSVHSFEIRETLQWNLRGTGDKLNESGSVCLVEWPQCPPEPLDLKTMQRKHRCNNDLEKWKQHIKLHI